MAGPSNGDGRDHRGSAVAAEASWSAEAPRFAMDPGGRVVAWNAAAARFFGWSSQQALGRRCWDLIRGRDLFGNRFCHERCAVRCMISGGEAVSAFEITAEGLGPHQRLSVATIRPPSTRGRQYFVHVVEPLEGGSDWFRIRDTWSRRGMGIDLPIAGALALTRRERQILGWIAAGLQNKEIAEEARISLATVRNHVHNLLDKLGFHSKLEAVSQAFRNGWVGVPPRGADATAQPAPQPGQVRASSPAGRTRK